MSARYRSTRFDPTKLTGDCAECQFAALCRAGCTTMAYAVTGTVHDNPFCSRRSEAEGELS